MSGIRTVLDYYKAKREKQFANIKWKASEEVKEGLLNLIKNPTDYTGVIRRAEGFAGKVYNEKRSGRAAKRSSATVKGWKFAFREGGKHVGQATIGYGHVLHPKFDKEWAPYWANGDARLTREEGLELCTYQTLNYAYKMFGLLTRVPTQGQFSVMLSKAYLTGRLPRSWIRAVNGGKTGGVAAKMRKKYDYLWGPKYEEPNWCANNVDKLTKSHSKAMWDKKKKQLKPANERVRICEGQVVYRLQYRKGWKNRAIREAAYWAGTKALPGASTGQNLAGASGSDKSKRIPKDAPRIYIAGDSNTYGHWKRHGASLLKMFGEDNRIINVSKGGYSLGRISDSLKNADGAKVVFIGSAGGNNVQETNTKKQWTYPTGIKIKSVKKLMQRLKELQDGGTKIIFYGIPFGGKCTKYSKNRGYADVALQAGAEEYGIPYTSVFERTKAFRGCKSGVHYASRKRKKAYREMFNELAGPDGKVTKEDLQRFTKSKRGTKRAKRKFLANVFGIKQFDIVPLDKKYEPGEELTKATKGIKGVDLSDEDFTKSFSDAVDELSDEDLEAYAKAMFDKGEEEIEVAQNEGIEKNNNLNCLFENWRGFLKED